MITKLDFEPNLAIMIFITMQGSDSLYCNTVSKATNCNSKSRFFWKTVLVYAHTTNTPPYVYNLRFYHLVEDMLLGECGLPSLLSLSCSFLLTYSERSLSPDRIVRQATQKACVPYPYWSWRGAQQKFQYRFRHFKTVYSAPLIIYP